MKSIFKAVLIALCLLVPSASFADSEAPAQEKKFKQFGRYDCLWASNVGYVYEGIMRLSINDSDMILGQINWMLKQAPKGPYSERVGMSGVEYVKGSFNKTTNAIEMKGFDKDDPDDVIGLDEYRVGVFKNRSYIFGVTKNNRDLWKATLTCSRL